jgi:hypothetical protein
MKKVTLFTALLILVLGVTFAFGFGMFKGTLKKEVVNLKLGDLNPDFKKFEGTDIDPFKDKPITFNKYNDQSIDAFIGSANKLPATLTFGAKCVADLNSKLAAAKTPEEVQALQKDGEMLLKVMTNVGTEATKLIAAGANLISGLQAKFQKNPMDLKHVKDIATDLKDAIAGLKTVPKDAANTIAGLTTFVAEVTKKAKDLATAATAG